MPLGHTDVLPAPPALPLRLLVILAHRAQEPEEALFVVDLLQKVRQCVSHGVFSPSTEFTDPEHNLAPPLTHMRRGAVLEVRGACEADYRLAATRTAPFGAAGVSAATSFASCP